jgi:hypothetical protein
MGHLVLAEIKLRPRIDDRDDGLNLLPLVKLLSFGPSLEPMAFGASLFTALNLAHRRWPRNLNRPEFTGG